MGIPICEAQKSIDHLKGDLLYHSPLATSEDIKGWVMEGPGEVTFSNEWMHMKSPEEEGHHVFWCPEEFPGSFIAQWELQNRETDAGLCIVFFSAAGAGGQNIMDPDLPPRDGTFNQYTQGDINSYHISYYANAAHNPDRPHANLRKNSGFHLMQEGNAPIPAESTEIFRMTLIKNTNHIRLFANDRKLIDWKDDGKAFGPVLHLGKIGLRQMRWTHFRYRNFSVWSLEDNEDPNIWSRHTIDESYAGADGIKMEDINEDGHPDIATGWEEGGVTKLYLHPGADNIRLPWPSVVVGATPSVEDAVFMDIVGDSTPEIISCLEGSSNTILVHELAGDSLKNPQDWKQSVLPSADGLMQWMFAEPVDIDHRSGPDLVAAGKGEDAYLGWFSSPQNRTALENWKWHPICKVGWIMSIIGEDMDGDGDQDLIITDRKGPNRGCRWLENPYPEMEKDWTNHMIGAEDLEVMFMYYSDIDGDGLKDAIVPERTENTVRIFLQSQQPSASWTEKVISLPTNTGLAKSVSVVDIDGDQTKDLIISTNTGMDTNKHGLIWLNGKNLEETKEEDFQSISGVHLAKYDQVILRDLDEDGDIDILICEENFGPGSQGLGLIWYENRINEE